MNFNGWQNKTRAFLAKGVALILVLVPFHAFLTVWLASAYGHYTLLRLWKEFLLLWLLLLAGCFLFKDKNLLRKLKQSKLYWLIAGYLSLQILFGIWALMRGDVNTKALGYAWIINTRFLLFFGLAALAALSATWLYKRWKSLLFAPAAVVVAVGVLQRLALPYDVLKHFGYGPDTIKPYSTVDQKLAYLRVQSTLRGANPLGAYLVVVLAALLPVIYKIRARKLWWIIGFAFAALALFFTYSRSAWLGTIVSLAAIISLGLFKPKLKRLALFGGVLLAVISAGGLIAFRTNDTFENTFFHTDEHSRSSTSSNHGHLKLLSEGAADIVSQPLGRGPGTAGPASVYNNHSSRIAENYFVQIGQEVGVLGLSLFILICVVLGRKLWRYRQDPLYLALLASLIGLSAVNLFSHAWADDSLSYLWWGFAGIAIGYEENNESYGTVKDVR